MRRWRIRGISLVGVFRISSAPSAHDRWRTVAGGGGSREREMVVCCDSAIALTYSWKREVSVLSRMAQLSRAILTTQFCKIIVNRSSEWKKKDNNFND